MCPGGSWPGVALVPTSRERVAASELLLQQAYKAYNSRHTTHSQLGLQRLGVGERQFWRRVIYTDSRAQADKTSYRLLHMGRLNEERLLAYATTRPRLLSRRHQLSPIWCPLFPHPDFPGTLTSSPSRPQSAPPSPTATISQRLHCPPADAWKSSSRQRGMHPSKPSCRPPLPFASGPSVKPKKARFNEANRSSGDARV